MSKDTVIAKAKSLEGRKAKYKNCETQPADTKVKKLPKDVKAGLEEHFKVKLDKVRVHTGGNVEEIAKSLKARAFVIDQNIYFRRPSEAKKAEVLAHELTHTMQLFGGKMKKKTKEGRALVCKK